MNLGSGAEARFAAYVEGLASVIGHADRAGPLRDYCTGPDAAGRAQERGADGGDDGAGAGRRRSTSRCCILSAMAPWSDEKVLAKVRELVLPAIEQHGPIEAWIIDDTAFPRRASIRSGCSISIAGSLASRPIARWRCRCRLPTTPPACRWPIGCICRRSGPRIARAGTRPACLRTSASRPSRRSRSSRSDGRARPAFRAAWC